jgi:hypothetical protein
MKEMQSQRSLEMAEDSNADTADSQVDPSQNS